MITTEGITYEARKSTPTDLGSRKKARECKSVANTVCKNKVRLVLEVKRTAKLQIQKICLFHKNKLIGTSQLEANHQSLSLMTIVNKELFH